LRFDIWVVFDPLSGAEHCRACFIARRHEANPLVALRSPCVHP
jgi:hypothetical protein